MSDEESLSVESPLPPPETSNAYPQKSNVISDDQVNVPEQGLSRKTLTIIASAGLVVCIGAILGGVCGTGHCRASSGDDATSASTLEQVRQKGVLRCGVMDQILQDRVNPATGEREGFSVDLCRATAAAALGTDFAVEIKEVTVANRFSMLQNGDIDLLAGAVTHTMERTLKESSTGEGFAFSVPYLYNGLTFAGLPDPLECADSLGASGNCTSIRICAVSGTTHEEILRRIYPEANLITAPSLAASFVNFRETLCQVMAGEQFEIAEAVARTTGYEGEYEIGRNTFSKEPLALVTRIEDPQWSDFVNWVLQSLLHAEEIGIAQNAAGLLTTTDLFGEAYSNMFIDAVSAVGNYKEMYNRHLEDIVPRGGANKINEGNSGLIYAMPFGSMDADGAPGGTLEAIQRRGHLRCGISRRAIFAILDENTGEWSGQDVDFCRALSAAIFNGVTDTVEFTDLPATDRFLALANGEVDVLSRITTLTFERDVLEPTSGSGFSFSQPNFYDGLSFGGVPPFGNCADELDTTSTNCQGLRICVNEGTTFLDRLLKLFPTENVIPRESGKLSVQGLQDGTCNAVAGGIIDVSTTNVREVGGYNGDYEIGTSRLTKDPLALVTRQDDPQWSAFCYWIVSAIFYAEEAAITPSTAGKMPPVNLFGSYYSEMFRNAIAAVGSFGEIYNRNVQQDVPRGGLNSLNVSPFGPQLYPYPGL